MTQRKKIWLGFFAFLPLISGAIYLVSFFAMLTNMMPFMGHREPEPEDILPFILPIIAWAIAMGIVCIGLLVYFIIHCLNNPYVDRDERIVWILLFIFLLSISIPIYWYMRVWNTPHADTSTHANAGQQGPV